MPVLYRTYRPAKWSEVIGQDPIVEALKETVAGKRLAHAYLFSGSRGTGKTTVARILAREAGAADEDIYEIDAASNRGIDDIRQLREHVSVMPFSSPVKVYIIDEVHMLSKDAWNALLKTLEEPPKHVIFILATTELDKVPETIVSRCQTFTFKKPGREVLRKQVLMVAKKEGFELDAGAADLVALLGDGSFRDALGMLEKVISASGGSIEGDGDNVKSSKGNQIIKVSRQEVEKLTGAPRSGLVNSFIEQLLSKNEDAALKALAEAEQAGISIGTFLTLILEKARFILLVQHSKSSEASVKDRVSPDDFEFISMQANKKLLTPQILIALLEAAEATPRAQIEALPLELAVVKACAK